MLRHLILKVFPGFVLVSCAFLFTLFQFLPSNSAPRIYLDSKLSAITNFELNISKELIAKEFTRIKNNILDLLYKRTIDFSGLKILKEKNLNFLLPQENSNLFWYFNIEKLKQTVLQNSYVKHVKVKPCVFASISCYKIAIEERTPTFVTADYQWLIAEDGTVLDQVRAFADLSLTKLEGVSIEESSPDLMKARVRAMTTVIKEAQKYFSEPIKKVAYISNDNISLSFYTRNYDLILSSDAGNQGLRTRLKEQFSRVDYFMNSELGRLNMVKELDLTLAPRLAILRYPESIQKSLS